MSKIQIRKPYIFALLTTIVIVGFIVGNIFVQQSEDGESYLPNPTPADQLSRKAMPESSGSYSSDVIDPNLRVSNNEPWIDSYPYYDQPGNPDDKYVIRSGEVVILIDKGEVIAKFEELKDMLPKGSYVSKSDITQTRANLLIKVPTDRLDETVKDFRELGLIDREVLTTTDIEAQYSQNEDELNKKKEQLAKLEDELAKTKNSAKRADIERQIESMKSSIKYYEDQKEAFDEEIRLSTLTVELRTEKPQEDKAILTRSWETSTNTFLVTIAGIMIVLSALLPFMVIAILVLVTVRTFKKRENTKEK